MKTTEQINKEHYDDCVAKLHAIDLPEVACGLKPNPWNFSPDLIILGVNNKALVCRNGWADHIATVLSKFFDGEINAFEFARNGAVAHYFTTCCNLTVPDRRAVEIFVRYFDEYFPGVEANSQEISFPKALSAYGVPIAFVEETDAYEAAEVISEIIRSEPEVIQTDKGFAVVVPDEHGDLTDYNFACVLGACRVLEDFTVSRKRKPQLQIDDNQEGTHPWQVAIGERYTQQARLEAKVDRLLSLIDDGRSGTVSDSKQFEITSRLDEALLRLNRIEIKQRLYEPAGA